SNVTTTGAVTIDADVDNDGIGDLTLSAGKLDTGNNNLTVTANDLSINISGAATITGTGTASFAVSDAGTIGVGDSTCGGTCGMQISGSEIGAITAANLTIGDSTGGAMTVQNVTLANTANTSNTLTLASGSTVAFETTTSSFTNSLAVSAVGNITQGVAITVGGASSFASTGGGITMNNATNSLGSNLTINAAQSFDVDPGATTTLTDLSVTIDPAGCAPCTYTLDISNLGDVSAFNLTDSGSDTTIGVMTATGLNLSITTTTGLVTTSSNIDVGTGSFSITTNDASDGSITISNTFTLMAGALTLDANGTSGDVNINDTVTITTGAVILTADDEINFSADGVLNATGAGNVSLTANTNTSNGNGGDNVDMTSGSSIDAGSGTNTLVSTGASSGSILLAQLTTTSSSSAAVTLTVGNTGVTGNITDNNAVATNISAVNGGLVIDAKSGVGSANALEVAVASVDIDNTNSNSINLVLAGDVAIANMTSANQINISGTGAITQTGAVTAVGTTTLDIGSGNDITLTNSSNDFATVVITSGNNVSVTDTNDLTLGASTISGTLTANAIGNLTVSGNVTVNTGISILLSGADKTFDLSSGNTLSTSSGDIDITADRMTIDGTVTATGQRVTLKSSTAEGNVTLGSASTGLLAFSQAEVNNITAEYLEIGSTTQGAIQFQTDVTFSTISVLHLFSGAEVSAVEGLGGGIVVANLAIEAGGDVTISDVTTDVDNLAIDAAGFDVTFYDVDDLDSTQWTPLKGSKQNPSPLMDRDHSLPPAPSFLILLKLLKRLPRLSW
ncbi:MAG: S-layer family protein, partial [Spongiibacteraceae bacterium]|nr:S-layer family protein [Spongiibacteraceae bacterium]